MTRSRGRATKNDALGRLQFERGASAAYPSLRGSPPHAGQPGVHYTATIDVPFYEARRVEIFIPKPSLSPRVRADGPESSPHRFSNGELCMWVPSDPAAHRWAYERGLLDLLDTIRAHLFREAWWREHDEWLGPELPHGDIELSEGASA